MRHLYAFASLGLIATTLLGCQATPPEAGRPVLSIQTDQPSYTARLLGGEGAKRVYGFSVVTRIENRGTASAYLRLCSSGAASLPLYGSIAVDVESPLETGYAVPWACPGSPTVRIAPGASRVDTVGFSGPSRRDGRTGEPYPSQVVEGAFRVFYEIGSCPSGYGCVLPYAETSSNVFDVSLAP